MTTKTFPRARLFTLVAWLLCLVCGLSAQSADSAEVLLRAAIDKEVVDGDVKTAIKRYQAIVDRFAKTNRGAAARALMHMADAYQKLGNAEADRIYGRVLRDYPEQVEVVSAARNRLAALRAAIAKHASGPVCTGCVGPFFHSFTVSADGRWLGYTAANNELMSRNLQTGEVKRLVGFPVESYGSYRFRTRRATWSRDSRQVAYFFRDTDAPGTVKDRAQLRVRGAEPGSESRTLVDNPDFIYVLPAAWSPDGQSILTALQRRDFTWQFAWVSAKTGAVTVLRSLNWQYNEFRSGPELSPDGRHILYATFTVERKSPGPNEGPSNPQGDSGRTLHILSADGSRDVTVPAVARGLTSPVWSPDGSRVLFVSDRDDSGSYDLWAVDVREGRSAGMPWLVKASIGTNVNLVGATRSGVLYYVQPQSSSRRIVVADLTANADGNTAAGPTTGFAGTGAAWSPDGKRLAWVSPGQLRVQSLETGRQDSYPLPAGAYFAAPAWQQDGSAVLVGIRNREDGRGFKVAQVTLETSEVRTIGTYVPPQTQDWTGAVTAALDGKTIFVAAMDSGSRERSVIAVDLASGRTTPVLSGLPGMPRLQQAPRGTVGQAIELRTEVVQALGLAPRADGQTVAATLMKEGHAYLATFSPGSNTYREVYGPLPARPWQDTLVSRLGDPKWLHDGLGVAFGIHQDDLSWKLMRVTDEGEAEPLGPKGSAAFTLSSGTLRFDISPDGRRVAYERLMTFSDELWALDLTALLKKPR